MLLYVFILQQSCVFYPFIHSWKTYLRPAGAEVQKLWTIFCFEALMAVCADDEGTFPYPPTHPPLFKVFFFLSVSWCLKCHMSEMRKNKAIVCDSGRNMRLELILGLIVTIHL